MKEVTKTEFFNHFKNITNVTTAAVGNYPFNWEVRTRDGGLVAKAVATMVDHEEVETFFIYQ